MRPQCTRLILNANGDPARFADTGLPVVADNVPDFAGPLAGILAGLDWAAAHAPDVEYVASVPGDCPFLPRDLVARLHAARACAPARRSPAPAPANGGIRWSALWPVALRDDLRHALTDEDLRKIEMWTARHGVALADWPAEPVDPFFNVNTPEDAAAAETLAAAISGRVTSAHQRRVGQKPDRRAGLERRHVLRQFGQPVGLGQRGDDAGAVLRMLDRLDRRRRRRGRSATRTYSRRPVFFL